MSKNFVNTLERMWQSNGGVFCVSATAFDMSSRSLFFPIDLDKHYEYFARELRRRDRAERERLWQAVEALPEVLDGSVLRAPPDVQHLWDLRRQAMELDKGTSPLVDGMAHPQDAKKVASAPDELRQVWYEWQHRTRHAQLLKERREAEAKKREDDAKARKKRLEDTLPEIWALRQLKCQVLQEQKQRHQRQLGQLQVWDRLSELDVCPICRSKAALVCQHQLQAAVLRQAMEREAREHELDDYLQSLDKQIADKQDFIEQRGSYAPRSAPNPGGPVRYSVQSNV